MQPADKRTEPNQPQNEHGVNIGSGYDQRGQIVYGDQINVSGNIQGNIILKRLDPADTRNQRNHAALRQMVRSFWIDGVLKHSLYNEVLIRLNLENRSDLVDNRPWDLILQRPDLDDKSIPPGVSILDIFDQMGQRLLILGEPGSGKTTMLLKLAEGLLDRAENDASHPTPVVFNLSSWVVERKALAEWLVTELQGKYKIPKKLAQVWIEKDELLPLLDGLDEVQDIYREACAEAINLFRQEHLVPLVVCSRVIEYRNLVIKLKLQGAILLQNLTPVQIENYLYQAGERLVAVRIMLRQDTELKKLARSPYILNIMTLAYLDLPASEVFVGTQSEVNRLLLFDAYINRMLVHRGVIYRYPSSQILKWLRWLAVHLEERGLTVFLWRDVQSNWLGTSTQKFLFVMGNFLIGILIGAVAYTLIGILNLTLIKGFTIGLLVGLSSNLGKLRPDEVLKQCWHGILEMIPTFRLENNLRDRIIFILSATLPSGLGYILAGAVVFGLVVVLIVILPIIMFIRVLSNILSSLRIGILLGLGVSILIFISVETSVASSGMLIGALSGLLINSSEIYITYLLLRIVLWLTEKIPWKYSHFLNDATSLIFLRKIGDGYIFAHRLIMEHFASLTDEDIARITAGLDELA